MKSIGFLSFGHWTPSPQSQTRTASDALLQSIDLAVAAEELGADGAYFRVHHFARQLGSPFPLLAAIGARTSRIEIGTAVIDMRYENPLYMVEDAGAADLIAGGRLQLGISRGSPEQVIETTQGVEAFDSRDRALVWRTTGGKHRYLLGVAGMLVDDDLDAFRRALAETLEQPPRPPVDGVERGWQELERRWNDWGACRDAVEIWRAMGIREPERIPDLDVAAVRAARPRRGERP